MGGKWMNNRGSDRGLSRGSGLTLRGDEGREIKARRKEVRIYH